MHFRRVPCNIMMVDGRTSIDLLVYLEKIFLLKLAKNIDPFKTTHFQFIDAGINIFRKIQPPNKVYPNFERLDKLPRNKLIFGSSIWPNIKTYNCTFNPKLLDKKYYHYIAAGDFLIHKDFIDIFVGIYKIYLEKLIDDKKIWTEQVVLTYIYRDRPELFYKLADGYCEVIKYLYNYRNIDIFINIITFLFG